MNEKQSLRKLALFSSIALLSSVLFAQGTLQMKDTYFHRFYYRSIIMGTSSVGKYNLDFINGKEAAALGFILDFPNNVVKSEKISQNAGLFFYGFGDQLAQKGYDPESQDSITGTEMNALSLCYGWNFYDIALGFNVYAGLNIYSGSKKLILESGNETKEKFFAPAPYLYVNKPVGEKTITFADVMLREDFKGLSKIAGRVDYNGDKLKFSAGSERNSSEYNDSYLTTAGFSKRFTSAWFFTKVIGVFSPTMRNLDPVADSGAFESFEETDAILGTPGYFNFKGGTAFNVNNLANEKVSDKLGNSGNYFGKFEFGYVLGMGVSYKVEEGFGWKVGFNYMINLDAAGGVETGDDKMNRMFKGKNVFVRLEYYKNYVNDDIMGLRIDPGMFRINLLIR